MNKEVSKNLKEKDLLEFLEEEYKNAENKDELDFWDAYSKLILENLELRNAFGYSQANLAEKLKTKQSVISRFENMGRLPSYDFLSRLSKVYNHKLGITLHGDFMAVVPLDKQALVTEIAIENKIPVSKYIQQLLEDGIKQKEKEWITLNSHQQEIEKFNSNILYPDFNSSVVKKNNFNLVPNASSEQNQELSIAV